VKEYLKKIEGMDKSLTEIEVSRKYGIDYRLEKGRTSEIIARLHPTNLNLTISEVIEETAEAKTFRLVSINGYLPPFEAGQYINLFVEIDGVRTSRPYSICSSPRQRAYYDITVARIAKGFVSDFFLDKVKPGDRFEANGPAGNFHYNRVFHGKKQVFLAGGSGITPFMSMISEVLNSGMDRQMHLIYGSRTPQAALFNKALEYFAAKHDNFTYSLVFSEPEPGFDGRTGFIDARCISDVVGEISGHMFYICGPEVMYDFCLAELEKLKVPARRIRREMFGPRQDIRHEPGWPNALKSDEIFTVNVKGRKKITAISGEPLVIALERAGFRVPVSCRSGECSLCRVKLVSGKVFQARGVLLRYADEKYGYIHSCKSYPISDMEIMLV